MENTTPKKSPLNTPWLDLVEYYGGLALLLSFVGVLVAISMKSHPVDRFMLQMDWAILIIESVIVVIAAVLPWVKKKSH